jgi:hypothetical protein
MTVLETQLLDAARNIGPVLREAGADLLLAEWHLHAQPARTAPARRVDSAAPRLRVGEQIRNRGSGVRGRTTGVRARCVLTHACTNPCTD